MNTSRMDLDENVYELQNRHENSYANANTNTNAMLTAVAPLVLHTRELIMYLYKEAN